MALIDLIVELIIYSSSESFSSYDGLLLQDRPLQVTLLPELCSHRQRHLQGETSTSAHGTCVKPPSTSTAAT